MALSFLGSEGWFGGQAAARTEPGAGRSRAKLSPAAGQALLPAKTRRGPTIHGKVQTAWSLRRLQPPLYLPSWVSWGGDRV